MLQVDITDYKKLSMLFPKTVDDIKQRSAWIIDYVKRELEALYALDDSERTFENTIRAFDAVSSRFSIVTDALSMLEMVSPDEAIRKASQEEIIKLKEFSVDTFANKRVYQMFKAYVDLKANKEDLSQEARYTLDESMESFKRQGFDLPDDHYQEVLTLKKELSKLATQFDTNIAIDKSFVTASAEQLKGVDEHLLAQLEKDSDNNYKLGCDYPTYFEVMGNCHNGEVRKNLFRVFNRRAFPHNYELLKQIMKKRFELAKKLGFKSFAALDFDSEMAKTPDRAYAFLDRLIEKCSQKLDQEMENFLKELPDGIALNTEGKFNPWDFGYVKECYKKKHLNIDERKIAEYFTVEKTVSGIFNVYQRFLGLSFKLVKPDWAWNHDVDLIEVRDLKGLLLGFIYLDLFPRADKYSHACHGTVISTIKHVDAAAGNVTLRPSVAVLIANFPKSGNGRPALLKFSDVETFFHEFGHAMHALLGVTELACNSGTAVKTDFVEMPSQMFENWLYEKDVLQPLSSHYKTGDQLPAQMIDKLIALKKFDSGSFVTRQCLLGRISLDMFDDNPDKDIDQLVESINRRYIKHISSDPESRFCASFGHLTGYGAKYYSYMWSKVFAIDVFYHLKSLGGIDVPEAGKMFVEKVLGRGGSVDPDELLKDLLGREPSEDAFVEDLGIHL